MKLVAAALFRSAFGTPHAVGGEVGGGDSGRRRGLDGLGVERALRHCARLPFLEDVGGDFGAEKGDDGREDEVVAMVEVLREGGTGRAVGLEREAHPEADGGDVPGHVHAVGAVEGAADIAQAGVIIMGEVAPEAGFHFRAELLEFGAAGFEPPQAEGVDDDAVVGGGVVLGEGFVRGVELVDLPGEVVSRFDPCRLPKVRASLDEEDGLHHGDVGVGRDDAVGRLALDGEADGVPEAGLERGGDAVGEFFEDDEEGGADELAPVGIVVLQGDGVICGRPFFLGRAVEGAVIGSTGFVELPAQDGLEDGDGVGRIVTPVAQEKADGPPGRFADEMGAVAFKIERGVVAVVAGIVEEMARRVAVGLHPVERFFGEFLRQGRKRAQGDGFHGGMLGLTWRDFEH